MSQLPNELVERAKNDLFFDIKNIAEYSISIGLKIHNWAKELYQAELVKDELTNKLAATYKERMHFYLYEYEYNLDKRNVDSYIKGDEVYLKVKKELDEQEKVVKFIQTILAALERQSFNLNNAIKFLEYQAGK